MSLNNPNSMNGDNTNDNKLLSLINYLSSLILFNNPLLNNINKKRRYNNNNNISLVLSPFMLLLLLSFLSITLLLPSTSYANNNNNDSCLTKDSNGNIIYNKKSNKKCILLRTIDSNTRNKLTNEGLESINGKSCIFDITYNYTNGEQLSGQTLPNGSTRQVRCNTGYSGDIRLQCNNGTIQSIGQDGSCKFVGCKKYDNDVLNTSLDTLLQDTSFTNSIVETPEQIKETNKDKIYNKNDTIDTLTCKTGYTGDIKLKCNGNDEIVVEGECEPNKCNVKDLYDNGVNTSIKKCTDDTCSSTTGNPITITEDTTETINYNEYVVISGCKTGFTLMDSRIYSCNENGEFELKEGTEYNGCNQVCNEMSAVFDVNGNKMSTQLKGINFANNAPGSAFYNFYKCKHPVSKEIITLNTNSLNVTTGYITYCDTAVADPQTGFAGMDRRFTCTADKTNKNGGKAYWIHDHESCDLAQIKNKGYEIYLEDGVTASQKSYQLRYPDKGSGWGYVKTSNVSYFTLRCQKETWIMEKSSSSCQGVPTLGEGSKFYKSDSDINAVGGQARTFFNPATFTQHTGTVTKDNLSTFIATNGSKIEASCQEGYTEYDRNGITGSGAERGGHYFECVNGTWTARGYCSNKVMVEYMSPRNGAKVTKGFENGQSITCDTATFGTDVDSTARKVCRINGYMVAEEHETFKVDKSANKHKYCHGSTIPYDLSGNANASVNINTWSGVTINKDSYRAEVKTINGIIEKITDGGGNGNEAKGSVICQLDGTWKLGSGYHKMTTTDRHYFKVPDGSKKSNKEFIIELYGGQGCIVDLDDSSVARGGYTKLVSQIANKVRELVPLVSAKFCINRLDYLYKGGRCSGMTKIFAHMLKIHPVAKVIDNKLQVYKKPRGDYREAVNFQIEEFIRDLKDKNIDLDKVYVTDSGHMDGEDEYMIKQLSKHIDKNIIEHTKAGCVISSHCGPKTIGVLYILKHPVEEKKK